jgi:hypothetical protein
MNLTSITTCYSFADKNYTSFNRSREHKYVSHKSRPAMQDMIPGLAPDPNMVLPFASLGITERLRRPILDHMLLGTLQACAIQICEHFL